MIYKISAFSLIFFLLLFKNINAQDNNYVFSAEFQRGFLKPHIKSMQYLINNYTSDFEIILGKKTIGTKKWHKTYNYPTLGFGYSYFNLGNTQILGNANSIFSYSEFSVLRLKKSSFCLTPGIGIAYLNKPFEKNKNYLNFVIGSHFNARLSLSIIYEKYITKRLAIKIGTSLTHYSNGAVQKPNKGVNILSLNTTISFYRNKETSDKLITNILEFKKYYEFSVICSSGIKRELPPWEKTYYVSSIQFNLERNINDYFRFGIGTDFFYDQSTVRIRIKDGFENSKTKDLFFTGLHLSADLIFGKFAFSLQPGWHFITPSKSYPNNFQRYALKFYASNKIIFSIGLKTNIGTAQFIECGIGYRFLKSK